jgi:TatD DNase family protein
MFDYGFVDAHCHLADPLLQNEIKDLRRNKDITAYISCALNQSELDWHWHNPDNRIKLVAGIHPYQPGQATLSLDHLAQLCAEHKIIGIGEIGLDKRAKDFESEKKILLQQLDLAQEYQLPVVLHVVKSYYQLAKLLKSNFPRVRGYLHGFHSSQEVFALFKKFDLAFSLGCRPPNQQVCRSILQYGHYLLETDAPFQKPISDTNQYNQLSNLNWVVEHLHQISNLPIEQIKTAQYNSLRKIFG